MSNIISIGCEYHALWGTNFLSVKFIFLKSGLLHTEFRCYAGI